MLSNSKTKVVRDGLFHKSINSINNLEWNKKVLYVTFITVIVVFALINKLYLTGDNLINIALQITMTAIVGVGCTFVIIGGDIDLSVGSVVGFSAMMAALAMSSGGGIWAGLGAGLGSGALIGLINGLITTKARVPAFLVTIGTMGLVRGLAMLVTATRPIPILNKTYNTYFGGGNILGIHSAIFWMIVIVLLGYILLSLTPFGRHVYATGGSRRAASYSGIITDKIRIINMLICGVLAGFVGILYAGRLNAARGTYGEGMELDVIAAVILGGASLFGGKGTIFGTLMGAVLIGALNNGLILMGLDSYAQVAVRGLLIVIAVSLGGEWHKKDSAEV